MSVRRRCTVFVLVGAAAGGVFAAASMPAAASAGPDACTVYVAPDTTARVASSSTQCCPNGKKAIGIVSFSSGPGAPAVGTPVCVGDKIGGPFIRVEVTVPGGSWNLFAGTWADMGANGNLTHQSTNFDGTFTSTKAGRRRHATHAAADPAPLPSAELDTPSGSVGLYADPGGVEACTITIHGGKALLHVVAGSGYAALSGQSPLQVPAGYGATVSSTGAGLTTSWPASARNLLPAAMRPPRVTGLRYRTEPQSAVVFRLDHAARVELRILRRTHVVKVVRSAGRRGANTVAIAHLGRGRYRLVLSVVDANGATTVAQRPIVVR